MHVSNKLVTIAIFLLLQPLSVSAATIAFSNHYYRSWNTVIYHEIGSPTSSSALTSSNTGTVGPVVESNSISYASAYASSDFLSLIASSNVNSKTIDQLGYDYAIAEATTRFEADMVISGGAGGALLDIDAFYNLKSKYIYSW